MSLDTALSIVPASTGSEPVDRTLAVICSKGNLDLAYPGLILAKAALDHGVRTHLFFTFWGIDLVRKSRMNDLKVTPTGNTANHLALGHLQVPQALAPLPGMQAVATRRMKRQIADQGVPEVPDLLEQIARSGGHLWACQLTADMMHLDLDDLHDRVDDIISTADFVELTGSAQLLFL